MWKSELAFRICMEVFAPNRPEPTNWWLSIFLLFPMAGLAFSLCWKLLDQFLSEDSPKNGLGHRSAFIKSMSAKIILLFWICLTGGIMMVFIWHPDVELSLTLKIVGLIILAPYLGVVGGIMGLAGAVQYGLSTKIAVEKIMSQASR